MSSPVPVAIAADRPPRRPSRRIALALVVLLAQLVIPSVASAHAALETISPADKSSGPAPTEIVGTFAENLDPSKSSFTLLDAAGTVVAQGGEVVSDDVRKMTLTLTTTLARSGAGLPCSTSSPLNRRSPNRSRSPVFARFRRIFAWPPLDATHVA